MHVVKFLISKLKKDNRHVGNIKIVHTCDHKIIGCRMPNTTFYCKLDSGEWCGLECGMEHGDYIYGDKY